MINTKRLKEIIEETGMSQRKVARELGITEKTFYSKMKTGVFNSIEMERMIDILNIEDPVEVFFQKLFEQRKKVSTEC